MFRCTYNRCQNFAAARRKEAWRWSSRVLALVLWSYTQRKVHLFEAVSKKTTTFWPWWRLVLSLRCVGVSCTLSVCVCCSSNMCTIDPLWILSDLCWSSESCVSMDAGPLLCEHCYLLPVQPVSCQFLSVVFEVDFTLFSSMLTTQLHQEILQPRVCVFMYLCVTHIVYDISVCPAPRCFLAEAQRLADRRDPLSRAGHASDGEGSLSPPLPAAYMGIILQCMWFNSFKRKKKIPFFFSYLKEQAKMELFIKPGKRKWHKALKNSSLWKLWFFILALIFLVAFPALLQTECIFLFKIWLICIVPLFQAKSLNQK